MSRAGRYDNYYEEDRAPPPRRRRDYDEIDVEIRERSDRRPAPDYLRPDYGASQAGPLVRRGSNRTRRNENIDVDIDINERDGGYSRNKPRRRGNERDDVDIDIDIDRQSRAPPPRRSAPSSAPSRNRDDIDIDIDINEQESRRPRRAPPSRNRDDIDIDIDIHEQESRRSRRPPPSRTRDDIDIDIDIGQQERSRPSKSRATSRAPPAKSRAGSDEVLDIKYSHRDGPQGHQDKLVIRERSNSRERSRPPPRPYARKTEDFYYRQRSPSPKSPPRQDFHEEIIIRRRKSRSPSPEPVREPSPEPPAPDPPIMRPPIVQEVITHRRTIDHGVYRAPPSPEPSPSPPPPPRRRRHEDIDIDIRRTDSRGNTFETDIDIHEDYGRNERRRERPDDRQIVRSRSAYREPAPAPEPPAPEPPAPRSRREDTTVNVNIEADLGGNSDRRLGRPLPPPEPRAPELWTEFTKDLVNKEGIRAMGFEFEETDEYFYVLDRLSEYQVRRLVEISEDFTYGRRDRIQQIQWERKDPRLPRPREIPEPRRLGGGREPPDDWEEVVYERERVYEDSPRGPRRIR